MARKVNREDGQLPAEQRDEEGRSCCWLCPAASVVFASL